MESGSYVDGLATKTLEQELAKFCGTKYAVAVSNGTAALYMALLDAGIGQGNEVLVPSHTFIATIEAICLTGATPVFCDVSPYTYNIRIDEIEKKRTRATKAIIPVHMYGSMCQMTEIMNFARKHNLKVIEDACQAIGAEQDCAMAGSYGDYGCFSFYPTKNLGTYGEGGAIVTNNRATYENIVALRSHNASTKYMHEPGGFNFRISEIQASVLLAKMRHLRKWIARRREIAGIYNDLIDGYTKPLEARGNKHAYHLYVIRSDRRDQMVEYMSKNDVGTGIHYPIPCHTQYEDSVSLPYTELLARQVISLPMFPELTNDEAARVSKVVNGF